MHERACRLVEQALHAEAPAPGAAYDLESPDLGRVKVCARSRASALHSVEHLDDVVLRDFDYLVLVEFEPDRQTVAGAWCLSWEYASEKPPGGWRRRLEPLSLAA